MAAKFLDSDMILLHNEEWMKLEEDWKPVDLDTEEDSSPVMTKMFSTLDLKKTTFDSAQLLKKVRRKVGRQLSSKSAVDYQDFIQNLQKNGKNEHQFFFVNGEIISAYSIEELCREIDDIFKSIDRLSSATSTLRNRKPEVVHCSISTGGLSFDDTNVDQSIEAFEESDGSEESQESVTSLVKKFSSFLDSPNVKCNPRHQRQSCSRFQELSDFWNNRALSDTTKY